MRRRVTEANNFPENRKAEVRTWLRTLSETERRQLVYTTKDGLIIESITTAPPYLSSLTGEQWESLTSWIVEDQNHARLAALAVEETRLDIVIVGAFGCLISYGVNATDALGRLLNSRLSVALGNWSYSIYLWHAPMQYAVMATFAASGYPVSNLGLSNARCGSHDPRSALSSSFFHWSDRRR
jgi:hypothetical protein